MYFKLAAGNVKKSCKDYFIYFLTLALAVCIFYSFNSIGSQRALAEIKSLNANYILRLTEIMSAVSVFVSVILGSLILYANNFLIKKRKKELAIYMVLGMGKSKISKILVTETFIVGTLSLIFGIISGILASQVLSVFTLKLFEIPMSEYKFTFSIGAAGKTILYFGIMFLFVMIFNIFVISKYKIIDLLEAGRKNENVKIKNPFIYLSVFILCVVCLVFAYKSILHTGLDMRNIMFKISAVLVILCTAAFFFSLSGFILYMANKNKKIYFKGLNIFVTKQISSKINTNFLSMSLICLMLFVTIVVLSTGISFKKNYETELKGITPFDASIIVYNNGGNENIKDILNKINFKISKNERYAVYNEYIPSVQLNDLFKTQDKTLKGYEGTFIKISDYNKLLKLKGENEISLNKNEVLILSNFNQLVKPINEKLKNGNKVNIKSKEYVVKNHSAIKDNLHTFLVSDNFCTIVINDDFLSGYKINTSVLNVMYSGPGGEENNKKYSIINNNAVKRKYKKLNVSINAFTKNDKYSKSKGSSTLILFVGIYSGIVFLITSMAVLSLQQLSEASDSIERYRALKKIGADKKMIDKAIFIQTFIYFSLPVALALVHSAVGIKIINNYIYSFGQKSIGSPALITALIFIAAYAGYFYTTYIEYKNIVKSNI